MKWPSNLAAGGRDILVLREATALGFRFIVGSRLGPQVLCPTYVEAEDRAIAYARRTGGHAWYSDGSRVLLLVSFNEAAIY